MPARKLPVNRTIKLKEVLFLEPICVTFALILPEGQAVVRFEADSPPGVCFKAQINAICRMQCKLLGFLANSENKSL